MFRKLLLIIINLILVGFFNPISNHDQIGTNRVEAKDRVCSSQGACPDSKRECMLEKYTKGVGIESGKTGRCSVGVGYNANTTFVIDFKNLHLS